MSFGTSASQSKSKSKDMTPSAYRALRWPVMGQLSSIMATGGGPRYEGPLVAGLTADELAGIGSANMLARSNPSAGVSRTELERTIRGGYLTPESNPFLRASIEAAQRPTLEAFEDAIAADRAAFAGAGQSVNASSPFAYARGLAERGLANALGDISTRIAGSAYESERARQLQATGALEEIDRGEMQRTMDALQASALPRLIEQLGYDKGLEEFRRRQEMLFQAIGLAGQLSSPTLGSFSSASSRSYEGSTA